MNTKATEIEDSAKSAIEGLHVHIDSIFKTERRHLAVAGALVGFGIGGAIALSVACLINGLAGQLGMPTQVDVGAVFYAGGGICAFALPAYVALANRRRT